MDDRDPQTFAIIGAAFEVHRHLGHGYIEPVYRHAISIEFGARAVPFVPEPELAVHYKGHLVGHLLASRLARALLLNFGTSRLEFKRLVSPSYSEPD